MSKYDIERFNELAVMLGIAPETMVQFLARSSWVEIYDPLAFASAIAISGMALLGIARWHGKKQHHEEAENVFAVFSGLALMAGIGYSVVRFALEVREAIFAAMSPDAYAITVILEHMSR